MSDNTALTDQQIVEQDAQTLYIGNTGTVEFDLNLPTEGKNGSAVSWQTSDDRWIKTDGTVEDILLHVKGLTDDEKEIILDGCLMNYYAKRSN